MTGLEVANVVDEEVLIMLVKMRNLSLVDSWVDGKQKV